MSRFLPPASVQIRPDSSHLVLEAIRTVTTRKVEISTLLRCSSAVAVPNLRALLNTLRMLPREEQRRTITLIAELGLQPLRVTRIKPYIHPTCYSILNYTAVRSRRRVFVDMGSPSASYFKDVIDSESPICEVISILQ